MLTKVQVEKLVNKLEAHRVAITEIRDGLKQHHYATETIAFLTDVVRDLDTAADLLGDEVPADPRYL